MQSKEPSRKLVLPGDLIIEGSFKTGPYTYYDGNKIFSAVFGLCEIRGKTINVIPLRGFYIPRVGDNVIGIIIDNSPTSWQVDINSPYTATLQLSDALSKPVNVAKEDIRKYFRNGDVLMAEVVAFDKLRSPLLSIKGKGLGKLEHGKLLNISPTRIPRLIGKRGSMIKMIKKELGCQILMGRNGRIWISSTDPKVINIVSRILFLIEAESHLHGLTDKVRKLIMEEREKFGV